MIVTLSNSKAASQSRRLVSSRTRTGPPRARSISYQLAVIHSIQPRHQFFLLFDAYPVPQSPLEFLFSDPMDHQGNAHKKKIKKRG